MKRKRARLLSKSIQASLEGITDGNKQPDMDELSRDLPSGWQVLPSCSFAFDDKCMSLANVYNYLLQRFYQQ